MATIPTDPRVPSDAAAASVSSVLAVIVSRNGLSTLPDCLMALARQSHPGLSVVAVDEGSTDGSRDVLLDTLGDDHVLTGVRGGGSAGALRTIRELSSADAADYLLLLHDDTFLEPDAVARMVEAAEGIQGVERVGVVGPKIVDADDPRLLREIGGSTDLLGSPYTVLQPGEIDQGQYDRLVEVLAVSDVAMLISGDALRRTGAFDARLEGHQDDLDFCWRARLAGFRVLMAPAAVARHRGVSAQDVRSGRELLRGPRYFAERAALVTMLRNYGLRSLLVFLPLYTVFTLFRLATLAITRRFEDAIEVLAAIGWNLAHLPGTLRARFRAQSLRVVRDDAIRRFMTSPFRLPRWFERAEEFLEDSLIEDDEESERRPTKVRDRVVAAIREHPVLIASASALVVGWLATRHLRGVTDVAGGALPSFPPSPADLFAELAAPVRTTLLGGAQGASPALAILGVLSFVALGDTDLAQRLLLMGLVPAAAVVAYRMLRRRVPGPGSATAAAVAYAGSATVLWSFSEGRIGSLVMAVMLPIIWERVDESFDRAGEPMRARRVAGAAIPLAVAAAFLPGAWLAASLVILVQWRRRPRPARTGASRMIGASVLGAAVLVLPSIPSLVLHPATDLASWIGTDDLRMLLRLAPGVGPGTGVVAAFLPILAMACYAATPPTFADRCHRASIAAILGVVLAWASAAEWLPAPLTNAPVYLLVAAYACAVVVGCGIRAAIVDPVDPRPRVRRAVSVLAAAALGIGLFGQSLSAALGGYAVSENGLPPAWPVIATEETEYRILWLTDLSGRGLPAPAGDPQGIIAAGRASVAYAITDRGGTSVLDVGRAADGAGYRYLRSALTEVLAGSSMHGGTLLAPLGIGFIVSRDGDLPAAVIERLREQVDIDLVPAGGLDIFVNSRAIPVAARITNDDGGETLRTATLDAIVRTPPLRWSALLPTGDGWRTPKKGSAEQSPGEVGAELAPGWILLSKEFDGGWRLEGEAAAETDEPVRAFGWATAIPVVDQGAVRLVHGPAPLRWATMAVMALAWAVALWVTRRVTT